MPRLLRTVSLFTILIICAFANGLSAQPGKLDPTFEVKFSYPPFPWVNAILLHNNERILIGGYFNSIDGISRSGIARLHLDGSLDTSFDPGQGVGGARNSSVHVIAEQADGKYIIGGDFLTVNGAPQRLLARLNANGSFDPEFRPMLSGNSVNSIVVQPDGRILVAGTFEVNSDGVNHQSIVRLNSDGAVDNTFHIPIRRSPIPLRLGNITLLEDSSMIISCGRIHFALPGGGGIGPFAFIKALTDGSLDPLFRHPESTSSSSDYFPFAVLPDNKILISSEYQLPEDGTTRRAITRLYPDGTKDLAFDSLQGPNGGVNFILPQQDGKILVGGNFTQFHSKSLNRIARLTANGEVDPSFDPGSGFDSPVAVLALQNDNKVLVGGFFDSFDGHVRRGIVRLRGGSPPSVMPKIAAQPASQNVPIGHNAIFEVSATGFPLSYQWQKDDVDLPGETRPTLQIWAAKTNDVGSYQVVASNSLGVAISTPARLDVIAPVSDSPSLVSNPSFEQLDFTGYAAQWTLISGGRLLYRYPDTAPVNLFGFQFPAHGTNYIAFSGSPYLSHTMDRRGPIFTQLKTPLTIGRKYEVSGWVSRPENRSSRIVDIQFSLDLGVINNLPFSDLPLGSIRIVNEKKWVPYRRTFVASKPYQQLWIGYPRDAARREDAALYFDDINVFELPPTAPEIAQIPDQTIRFGKTMTLDLRLLDVDVIDQLPLVSLADKTPTNAVIELAGKSIRFQPRLSQVPSTNTFTVIASYPGFPTLTSTQTFRVFVPDQVTLALGRGLTNSGAEISLPLTLRQYLSPVDRLTNISFSLQYPSDRIAGISALAASPSVASVAVETTSPTNSIITLALHNAEPDHAESPLATLAIQTAQNPMTAAIALTLSDIVARKEDGSRVGVELGADGALVLIGEAPYVSAQLGENGHPELLIHGKPGIDHIIESTETPYISNSWKFVRPVTLTNLTHTVRGLDLGATNMFFRVRR